MSLSQLGHCKPPQQLENHLCLALRRSGTSTEMKIELFSLNYASVMIRELRICVLAAAYLASPYNHRSVFVDPAFV